MLNMSLLSDDDAFPAAVSANFIAQNSPMACKWSEYKPYGVRRAQPGEHVERADTVRRRGVSRNKGQSNRCGWSAVSKESEHSEQLR